MSDSDKTVEYKVNAGADGFVRAMDTARHAATQLARGVESSFGAAADKIKGVSGALGPLGSALQSANRAFMAFAAVIGAGAGIVKAVEETARMTEGAMDLGRALGVSTNEARVLQAAMDDLGAPTSELEGAAKGLSRNLRENEADMNKLGLVTRDAAGNLRPMNDLVLDGIQVLNGYKEGADRAVVSQHIFGRSMEASSRLLLLNKEVIDENRQAVEDLGLQIGENAKAAWREFDASTDRANLGMKGLTKAIGDSVMPVMTDLVRLFNSIMPAAITIVRGALSGLTAAFLFVKNGVVVLWETINAMVITVAEPIRALGEAVGRALVGDFSGAAAALKGIAPTIADAWGNAFSRMAEMSEETKRKVLALFQPDTVVGETGGPKGTRTAPRPVAKSAAAKKEGADPSQMAAFEAQLEAERVLAAERDALHGMSKRAEQSFWDNILATAKISEADRLAVQRKASHARVQVLQEEARQADQISKINVDAWEKGALAGVDADADAAKHRLAIGEITQSELLAQEQGFEQRRFEIRTAALQANAAALDPTRDPVQVAQINAQIEELERAHQQRMGVIRGQAVLASRAQAMQIAGTLQSGFASVLSGIGTTITSIGGLIKGLLQVVVQTVIQMLAQLAAKWLVSKLMMRSTSKSSALSEITAEAGKAGAGGTASMAAAPWPLNTSAPVFGAAMSALAMGYAPMASAAQGYDIPAWLNPITQLHQSEMVLPARYADVIRGMADGGGQGGGMTVSINAHPMPGNYFMVHRDQLVKALKSAQRDNAWSPR